MVSQTVEKPLYLQLVDELEVAIVRGWLRMTSYFQSVS